MAAFPHITIFFLVFSTLTHTVFSGALKHRDFSKWPKPPCKMYYPMEPDEDYPCPDVPAYVCATNGHTYKNECFFCVAQWELNNVEFHKYGKCD
ncbi:serine protease inhibitor Kazal-type 13 [Pteropus alecto]|uniref:serine protease inhibitor Kazal-type 13 n=1 Tax=Pteropus alecto TaxID=9402 RepID=UPI00076891B6|nr:serine protease inhibitor Kazal-type 13 [Pteropus alecto]XP_024898917.1 serine protease inhibitor Kazal-type 13 [Pteropus alecto]